MMKSTKPKMKFKYKFFLYSFLLLIYILVAFSFVNNKVYQQRCTTINVNIVDSSAQMFVTPKDINKLLTEKDFGILGYPIAEVNDLQIEECISKHPSIENVEVYKSSKGSINIDVKQRKPLARIIDESNNSYYIDQNGTLMPLSKNYTARVPIITGQFSRAYSKYKHLNLCNNFSDTLLADLFLLVKEIKNASYWSAQCEQIYVNRKKDIILIPKIGADEIVLGQNRNFAKDLDVLTAFYQQALPYVGWDKYKTINLRYNKQIVCVK